MEFFYQVFHPFQADVVAYVRKVGFVFVSERSVWVFSSFSFFKQDLSILFKHLGGLPISLKQCNADLFCLQNNNQDEVLTTWVKSGSSAIE